MRRLALPVRLPEGSDLSGTWSTGLSLIYIHIASRLPNMMALQWQVDDYIWSHSVFVIPWGWGRADWSHPFLFFVLMPRAINEPWTQLPSWAEDTTLGLHYVFLPAVHHCWVARVFPEKDTAGSMVHGAANNQEETQAGLRLNAIFIYILYIYVHACTNIE